jgi:hypothetical protein
MTSAPVDAVASRFSPLIWEKNGTSYGSAPLPFIGLEPGCTHPYGRLPSLLGLFLKFWSLQMQRKIVQESNQYASEVIDDKAGTTRGGADWIPLCVDEFRAYIAICLLMGLKRLPSKRLYWSKPEPLFRCPLISQWVTCDRFEVITRCLHVANAPTHVLDSSSPTYDKLHKLRWMLDEVRSCFRQRCLL